MWPDDERFDAKTSVLIENVELHIEKEDEWFPQVRKSLGRRKLQKIGAELPACKKAPTSPRNPLRSQSSALK